MAEGFEGTDRGMSAMGDGSTGLGNSTNALGEPADSSRMDSGQAAQGMRERASEVRRDVLDRAVEKKDELKQRATGALDERRTSAAHRVNAISRALTGAAESLRDNGEPQLSDWVRQAATQVERVVDYLEGKPVDGMVTDLEDMARRHPALFMGGTYAAGLALGRFLRASSPQPRSADNGALLGYEGSMASPDQEWRRTAVPDDLRSQTGSGWTGAAVGPSFSAGQRMSSDPGDGEPGLTDEDLREAWHGDEARPDNTRNFGARDTHHDALDTGELTSYTNGDADRERGV